MKLTKQKLKEIIREELLNERPISQTLPYIVDNFTRYLVGDPKTAISNLKRYTNKVEPIASPNDSGLYNKVYRELFDGMYKAAIGIVKKYD